MIFVTVGSQKFPFDRLIKKVDQMAGEGRLKEPVFIQTGSSNYIPRNCQYRAFCDRKEFTRLVEECSVLITHGGAGTMLYAVNLGKKIIVVPRRVQYGEHVDDHQLQLLEQFHERNLVYACLEVEDLPKALETIRTHSFDSYSSNTEYFVASLDEYLRSL
ncbi:MAG: beta(1,3)galactosyltransferase EpsH [Lachnospiraceae bacterium]|jgi:UDP-N-acetylglucosamine transferase subunit ALG13|nr:beta(1,3)galactosyltransferase EpsH [Lachnospiraceae bacterium]MCX4315382.1 glycosyltransferase [Lachnospiraceae bacterium]